MREFYRPMSVSNHSGIQTVCGLKLLIAVLYAALLHLVGFNPSNQFTTQQGNVPRYFHPNLYYYLGYYRFILHHVIAYFTISLRATIKTCSSLHHQTHSLAAKAFLPASLFNVSSSWMNSMSLWPHCSGDASHSTPAPISRLWAQVHEEPVSSNDSVHPSPSFSRQGRTSPFMSSTHHHRAPAMFGARLSHLNS